jgi:hypothetical protein
MIGGYVQGGHVGLNQSAIDKLCAVSCAEYRSPYESFEWPAEIGDDAWCMAPEYISLNGTPQYAALSDAQRRRLSRYEAVNLFSVTVHGEKSFIAYLAPLLYNDRFRDLTPYMLHFLDEENKHLVYFGEFCTRYAGKIYPTRIHQVDAHKDRPVGERLLIFFASVLAFEQMTDALNAKMGEDARLHPLARQINLAHHKDESRHIAFGRLVVQEMFEREGAGWAPGVRERVQADIEGFMDALWNELFNPDVYIDAGFDEPFDLRDRALATPDSAERWAAVTASTRKFFVKIGLWSGGKA